MSFLSVLGKVAGFVPLPGMSTVGKALEMAGDVASVGGKQAAGAAQGKIDQATLNQRQDQNALANYIAQQNAQNSAAQTDLQRKQFESSNRGSTAKQALIGALLGGGMQATKVGPSGASGGLLASLNGNPDALAAMKMLASQAGSAQSSPLSFEGGKMLQAPTLTALPKVDQGGFLSTLANIGQLAGAASPYLSEIGKHAESNGASKPQAVDVIGSIPGGAYKPRTVDPYLQSRDMRDLFGGNG